MDTIKKLHKRNDYRLYATLMKILSYLKYSPDENNALKKFQ